MKREFKVTLISNLLTKHTYGYELGMKKVGETFLALKSKQKNAFVCENGFKYHKDDISIRSIINYRNDQNNHENIRHSN